METGYDSSIYIVTAVVHVARKVKVSENNLQVNSNQVLPIKYKYITHIKRSKYEFQVT